MDPLSLRAATADDAATVRRICLRTGDAGRDASDLHADPDLLGHVWAQPYLELEPRHAYVAVDADGAVLGYVLGTPDSRAFEARADAAYWPALRGRYPLGPTPGRTAADQDAVALVHAPPRAPAGLLAAYPGHLHVDLLPEAQGRGAGRLLVEAELASLAAAGCSGAYVGVDPRNEPALGFYRRLGFVPVASSPDVEHLGIPLGGPSR
ncbi:MAG: GNAT family N-acetyltransferase [Candidatus Nanopelagicales bacterium]